MKFLRPNNAFYEGSYNEYDLFGKNDDINTDAKTVMAHYVWSNYDEMEHEFDGIVLDDSVLHHPQRLTLAERMERAVYLGLDEKNITAKFSAGRRIIQKGREINA